MNIKKYVILGFLFAIDLSAASQSISKNTWIPRSFSSYLSRSLPLKRSLFYLSENLDPVSSANYVDNFVSSLSCSVEYMQSFDGHSGKSCNLGSMPFWSGTNVITVGNNDGDAQLDAYQFGLGNVQRDSANKTMIGSLSLKADVSQVGGDISFYLARSCSKRGWFAKVNVPVGATIIHTKVKEAVPIQLENNVNFTQTTIDPNSSNITYNFARYPVPDQRAESLIDAFIGGSHDTNMLDGNSYKIIRLRKGRIPYKKQENIRVADIGVTLGYNILAREDSMLSLSFKASLPTGNKPTADYMLEPILGRAGLWGIGADIEGHCKVWESLDHNKFIDISFHSEVLTLRPGRTYSYRSFDLKQNGPGSKYLLIQHYPAVYNKADLFAQARIGEHIQPAINITTMPVISKFSCEGSAVLAGTYWCNNWNVGMGVEIWGRTQEKLSIDSRAALDQRIVNLNDFAVLGRQISRYRIQGQSSEIATYYCEPLAQIGKSQDAVQLVGSTAVTPPGVTAPSTLPDGIKDARTASNRIPTNLDEALDICGAQAPSAFTAKLFVDGNYQFKKSAHTPMLGAYFGVEVGKETNSTVDYWSVGIKGSIAF